MSKVLVFNRNVKESKSLSAVYDAITECENLRDDLNRKKKALSQKLWKVNRRLCALQDSVDDVIGKIAERKTLRGVERVRVISVLYAGGGQYYAVKIKKDGSDSKAYNAHKRIDLTSCSGWRIFEGVQDCAA